MFIDGVSREQDAYHDGSDRRSGTQDAQTFRTVMENLLHKSRQHGDCTAKQHREHVQRLRSQDDLVAEHKAQTFSYAGKYGGRFCGRRFLDMQR